MGDSNEFTTIESTIITQDEQVQRFIDKYKNAFDEGKTQITDFNEGSEIMNLLNAIGSAPYELRYLINDLKMVAFPQYSRNQYLDLIGARCNCERYDAKYATGIVTLSVPSAKTYNNEFPAGTIITTEDDSVEVELTEGVILTAGMTSITATAQAINAGTDGNVLAGTLTRLADPVNDVLVTNASAFTGGTEEETDESYKTRILEAEKAKVTGSVSWYKSQTEDISGVHDAKIINNPEGTLYNVKIIVNGDTKPTPDALITAVSTLFANEEKDIAGIAVNIVKPNYVEQVITATITLKDGYVWADVLAALQKNVNSYFNGGETTYSTEANPVIYPGLDIGDDIIRSTIMLIIANTPGVLDYNLTAPSANVVTTDDEEAHLASMTFTQG